MGVLGPLGLGAERNAAVDRGDAQPLRLGERAKVRCDLGRKLAGRDENERRRASIRVRGPLDERQPEGKRLAGAGGRLCEDVESGERVREDELLHRKRLVDIERLERAHDRRADAERQERLRQVVLLLGKAGRDTEKLEQPEKEEREAGSHGRRMAIRAVTVARVHCPKG